MNVDTRHARQTRTGVATPASASPVTSIPSTRICATRAQARGYVTELNNELKNKDSSVIKKLINIKSDFEKCKQFTYRPGPLHRIPRAAV